MLVRGAVIQNAATCDKALRIIRWHVAAHPSRALTGGFTHATMRY
jgi:hypothetical protein